MIGDILGTFFHRFGVYEQILFAGKVLGLSYIAVYCQFRFLVSEEFDMSSEATWDLFCFYVQFQNPRRIRYTHVLLQSPFGQLSLPLLLAGFTLAQD